MEVTKFKLTTYINTRIKIKEVLLMALRWLWCLCSKQLALPAAVQCMLAFPLSIFFFFPFSKIPNTRKSLEHWRMWVLHTCQIILSFFSYCSWTLILKYLFLIYIHHFGVLGIYSLSWAQKRQDASFLPGMIQHVYRT